jgi:hypothetical protein
MSQRLTRHMLALAVLLHLHAGASDVTSAWTN